MYTLTLPSGQTFDVITIPKGTVLFRGFNMYAENTFFTELFGKLVDGRGYCVDNHQNVFFYPAPFVSDTVSDYPVHAIYIVQYDLDVVLLTYPSKACRGNKNTNPPDSAIVTCNKISKTDSCGQSRTYYDPCLSPILINTYPHIKGYIAIAAEDAATYRGIYYSYLHHEDPDCSQMTTPFVVGNSRKLQAIPEIVLYPLQSRNHPLIHPRAVHEHGYVQYAIKNRSLLNYFPLAYISETKYYSFLDMEKEANVNELMNAKRFTSSADGDKNPDMIHAIKRFVDEALNPRGIYMHGTRYRFTIDLRTGFYRIDLDIISKRPIPYVGNTVRIRNLEDDMNILIPFYYPVNVKKQLHGYLMRKPAVIEEELLTTLNRFGASVQKYYQFDKGNPYTYKMHYKMDTSFPRPDLSPYTRRRFRSFTRKIPRFIPTTETNTTRKKRYVRL